MQCGEYLGLETYFSKGVASIYYYYDINRKDEDSYDDEDIRLDPKSGLKSPSVSDPEIEEDPPVVYCEPEPHQLLCTRNMESRETDALERKARAIFYI